MKILSFTSFCRCSAIFTNKKTRSVCLSVCLSVRLYVSPCVDLSRWKGLNGVSGYASPTSRPSSFSHWLIVKRFTKTIHPRFPLNHQTNKNTSPHGRKGRAARPQNFRGSQFMLLMVMWMDSDLKKKVLFIGLGYALFQYHIKQIHHKSYQWRKNNKFVAKKNPI